MAEASQGVGGLVLEAILVQATDLGPTLVQAMDLELTLEVAMDLELAPELEQVLESKSFFPIS